MVKSINLFSIWSRRFSLISLAPPNRYGMFWYRVYVSFGRNSIVGTTVKAADKLPQDVVADEKHSWLRGEKVYIPTTVAHECILGVDIADDAGTKALTEGYQTFKTESQHLDPTYRPRTVNTDGWSATQNAWQALFPKITLILCFLHAFMYLSFAHQGYVNIIITWNISGSNLAPLRQKNLRAP